MFVADRDRAKSFYEKAFDAESVYEDGHSIAFKFENMIVNLLVASEAHDLIAPAVVAGQDAGSRFQLTIGVDDVDAVCEARASRDRAHPIARRACVLLRVKDDHREPVQLPTAGRPRPVARLETGRTRDLRHNLAVEQFPSAVGIVDGYPHDERMHLRLPSRCIWSAELNAGRPTVMQRVGSFEAQCSGEAGRARPTTASTCLIC